MCGDKWLYDSYVIVYTVLIFYSITTNIMSMEINVLNRICDNEAVGLTDDLIERITRPNIFPNGFSA